MDIFERLKKISHKQKVAATEELIANYERALTNPRRLLSMNRIDCPLCQLVEREESGVETCGYCIHIIITGMKCHQQKTYMDLWQKSYKLFRDKNTPRAERMIDDNISDYKVALQNRIKGLKFILNKYRERFGV